MTRYYVYHQSSPTGPWEKNLYPFTKLADAHLFICEHKRDLPATHGYRIIEERIIHEELHTTSTGASPEGPDRPQKGGSTPVRKEGGLS
jgi:hypothetical protein